MYRNPMQLEVGRRSTWRPRTLYASERRAPSFSAAPRARWTDFAGAAVAGHWPSVATGSGLFLGGFLAWPVACPAAIGTGRRASGLSLLAGSGVRAAASGYASRAGVTGPAPPGSSQQRALHRPATAIADEPRRVGQRCHLGGKRCGSAHVEARARRCGHAQGRHSSATARARDPLALRALSVAVLFNVITWSFATGGELLQRVAAAFRLAGRCSVADPARCLGVTADLYGPARRSSAWLRRPSRRRSPPIFGRRRGRSRLSRATGERPRRRPNRWAERAEIPASQVGWSARRPARRRTSAVRHQRCRHGHGARRGLPRSLPGG